VREKENCSEAHEANQLFIEVNSEVNRCRCGVFCCDGLARGNIANKVNALFDRIALAQC
jgi:hypothetical protein